MCRPLEYGDNMPNLYCQEPGCGGDGIIHALFTNKTTKKYLVTGVGCPRCNPPRASDIVSNDSFLEPYGTTEAMLINAGYHEFSGSLESFNSGYMAKYAAR